MEEIKGTVAAGKFSNNELVQALIAARKELAKVKIENATLRATVSNNMLETEKVINLLNTIKQELQD
ncbi:hypothetical protein [Clostridium tyrobutyricum]|uniref:hypothetical protein n=1 Tax=Clostridium tyrobutyricum TaxID=1519 RepID=UPI001C3940BC|nr:hypothetical protein [Clostridium tyrobutyricum]MBV4429049.1 hypothetical protein [Clostridium tyrobutyricum]MBV4444126.1 hypothetical protein [Clostridium tyrobutyricum]